MQVRLASPEYTALSALSVGTPKSHVPASFTAPPPAAVVLQVPTWNVAAALVAALLVAAICASRGLHRLVTTFPKQCYPYLPAPGSNMTIQLDCHYCTIDTNAPQVPWGCKYMA